ncbi:MAG: hypothetical protein AAF703_06095 [Cyanobacteria bacterium P01_D01_bin.105]
MDDPFLQRMRIYLHLVPVFGIIPSLWTLSQNAPQNAPDNTRLSQNQPSHQPGRHANHQGKPHLSIDRTHYADSQNSRSLQLTAASKLSVLIGLGSISAIALLGATASSQATQLATLRLLIGSSFIGSGYFLLSLALMFRVAKGQSIRIPGITPLSRRLP